MKKSIFVWHTLEDAIDFDRKLLFAITNTQKCEYKTLVGKLRFTTEKAIAFADDAACIAWMYIDDEFPKNALEEWKKHNFKSEEQIRLDKIRELEEQIKQLKSELNATPSF